MSMDTDDVSGRKDRIKELQKFMSPKYVGLAFNLPPDCGTFWGLMEEEISRADFQDLHPFTSDVNEVLTFLRDFFSSGLVEQIGSNMLALEKSFLGIDYTLRRGKGMIAKAVLDDVQLECDSKSSPLHDFLGHVDLPCGDGYLAVGEHPCPQDGDDGNGGWQRQGRRHMRARGSSSSGESSNLGRGGGRYGRAFRGSGRGVGSGGEGGGRRQGVTDLLHFPTMDREMVLVPMSPFSTPPFDDPERAQSIKSRSWSFMSHDLVGHHGAFLYDPHLSTNGTVHLFHGTRQSSLVNFQRRGIAPRYHRNEFSMDEAFYVCNSIRQAYEHPLHYHPSRTLNETVSVLVFEIDASVLHGLKPPPGKTFTLTNLWFRDVEDDLLPWQRFCKDNFKERGTPHGHDIVIGPVCLPRDDGSRYSKLSVSLPSDAPLTQIAFCSRRARAWLEQCFKRVYVEQRGAN